MPKKRTKTEKKKVGFTCGTFDLCHTGHMLVFKEAWENCDYLVVGLHADPSIERPSKNKPVMSIKERRVILDGIRYIDKVIEYSSEKELINIIKKLKPDVRFLGEDWRNKPYTGHELGIPVFWNSRTHGYSSTTLRQRVYEAELAKQNKKGKK